MWNHVTVNRELYTKGKGDPMKEIQDLLLQLTIEEKAALLEGYQSWMTNAIPRLDISAIHLTDGPVGVRKKVDKEGEGAVGLGASCPATVFPASVSIANSWNVENAKKMGQAIGEECIGYDVQVLLAPALNLKRDPRCGRNFEYFSEDPLLAGKMAAAFVQGVQSTGTAACPKHFAINNNENFRYMCDAVIDERAARELYLKAFEICVKEAKPRTMMCAYNKINGEHCSQNKWLLTDVLRNEWGYEGLVMTDWGATVDRQAGVIAGLDLDMPGGILENRKNIIQGLKNGQIQREAVDEAVANVLKLIKDALQTPGDPEGQENCLKEHERLAINLAADSAVLLQNDGTLPLNKEQKILVVGALFEKMRYQGAGSSNMNPAFLTTPRDAFEAAGTDFVFVRGYDEKECEPNTELEAETLAKAADADVILFFGGLTDNTESEGIDRETLSIPDNQLHLMEQLCEAGKKVVTVLFGGAAFEIPFAPKCAAILHMFLPGEGGGEACRRLLYGMVNPSGKLSETWMRSISDIPFGDEFGQKKVIAYKENIYVGYRYFDEKPECVAYPFGHGLSYTQFEYSDLKVEHEDGIIKVIFYVKNAGAMAGAEVVQLYVGRNENTAVFKAAKELKAFNKIYLAPGESRLVALKIAEKDLAYYNTKVNDWIVENGEYPIFVGSSSRDIRLQDTIKITGYEEAEVSYHWAVIHAYRHLTTADPKETVTLEIFENSIGRKLPAEPEKYPFTIESPLMDFEQKFMGKIILKTILKVINSGLKDIMKLPDGKEKEERLKNHMFMLRFIHMNCPRSLAQSGGGMIQMNLAYALTYLANGKLGKAFKALREDGENILLPCEQQKNIKKEEETE